MLFLDEGELVSPLPLSDPRVLHVLKVLKKGVGETLLAGTSDGIIGTARIETHDDAGMRFSFTPEREAPALYPVTLLLGFPRPIQAKRILKDLTSLGIGRIILSGTELGEKSYFQSDFFKDKEYRQALIEGAQQAANPRLPAVETAWSLARALGTLGSDGGRWAFDPYRAGSNFGSVHLGTASAEAPLVLAVGSERGWTEAELELLADRGFTFARLGERVLKSETASVVAVSIALARLGYI
jgi:16S rRNA (uracil1498-N3)-methyltransferase